MKNLSHLLSESMVNEKVESYSDEIVVAVHIFDDDETYIVAGENINKIKAQLPPQLKQFAAGIDSLDPVVNVGPNDEDFRYCRVFIDEPEMVIIRIK